MKLNKKALAIGAVLFGTGLLPLSLQAIEVFPIVKEIEQSKPRDNFITVRSMFTAKPELAENKSEKEQYEFVTLELFSITNPGAGNEILEKELGKDSPYLVYSPSRIIIPYGEQRKIRIMPMKPVEQEKLFRLRVRPSYPEDSLEPGKVRFAIGYDVLIRYLPEGPHRQGISIQCSETQWTISATGNVRSEMRKLVIDGRQDQDIFNVYPGHPRTLKVNKTLAFEMDNGLYSYDNCSRKE